MSDCTVRDNCANMGGGVLCNGGSPFTRRCAITANTAESRGGGVCCLDFCTPTMIDCVIADNASDYEGGGVCCLTVADATIVGCTVARNASDYSGGGIACDAGSDAVIIDCAIIENQAEGYGGGVSGSSNCSLLIANCDISRNAGRLHGGGFYASGCDSFILNSTFIGNRRASSGGAVYCGDGATTLTGCQLSLNRSEYYSGGIECSRGVATLTACTITLNQTTYNGGGVVCDRARVALADCTIAGNQGDDGAGVQCDRGAVSLVNCAILANSGLGLYCDRGTATLTNCSIAGNDADEAGAGLRCRGADVVATNCILWDDTPSEIYEDDSNVLVTYSDVQGGWTGAGNIDADPFLAFAQDAHLSPGSPCIDAGTPDVAGGLPFYDQDGNARTINGDGSGEAVVDMGAYEYDPDDPILTCIPFALEFVTYIDGPTTAEDVISIRAGGDTPLSWFVEEDCPWLEVSPASGQSSSEVDEVTVTADALGLASGTYGCLLRVAGHNAYGSPRGIPVMLRVGHGYPTIQMWIDAAEDGDTVLIPDGRYTGPGNKEIRFRGKAITVRSENGPDNCLVDCEHDGRGFYFMDNEAADSVLDGLTITNGDSPRGGAIRCGAGHPTITNCVLFGNYGGDGGGVYTGRATFIDCLVYENTAEDYGGGIYCVPYSNPRIINCVVECNRADYSGGGISCDLESKPLIVDCLIRANTAETFGGGIECDWGDAEIRNCTITENVSRLQGGGILSRGGEPTIVGCRIAGNTASMWAGGGIYCTDAPRVLNCVITGNSAPWSRGGGVLFAYGSALMVNCQITDNTALCGGAVSVEYEATPVLCNATMAHNSAEYGGGLYAIELSHVLVQNSILWQNTATMFGPQIAIDDPNYPAVIDVSYSDAQGGPVDVYVVEGGTLNWGDGNIDADPVFADPNAFDYRPTVDSPCIDAGDNDALFDDFADLDNDGVDCEEIPVDLDGSARRQDVVDVPDSGSGFAPIVDMGAFELGDAPPAACPMDFNGDGKVGIIDLAIVLGSYGSTSGVDYGDGDSNCDGDVDRFDLFSLLDAYGLPCDPGLSHYSPPWQGGVGGGSNSTGHAPLSQSFP